MQKSLTLLCSLQTGFPRLVRDYSDVTANELLGLCADRGNRQAWDEFLRRFHPLVMATVYRVAGRYTRPHPDLCDDVAQELYLKLNVSNARLLREFEPRHQDAAFAFVKVVTANVVHDHFKRKGNVPRDETAPDDLPGPGDTNDPVLIREIDDYLRQRVREVDRRIFWLYYRHGMTANEVAAIPAIGLTIKGVESILVRLRQLIRAELFGPQSKSPCKLVDAEAL